MNSSDVVVIKCDPQGAETWRYSGRVLERGPEFVRLEARFNRPDTPFHGIVLGNGDRFLETFFSNHWYNIMEIHDRGDDVLKGWYCNVTHPAEIRAEQISYRDLALDLLVYPNGSQLVLDEDEFAALALEPDVAAAARRALVELQDRFKRLF